MTASHPFGGRLPLLSARPAVTSPAAEHHRPLAGTKLYCLVIKAHKVNNLRKVVTQLCPEQDLNPQPIDRGQKATHLAESISVTIMNLRDIVPFTVTDYIQKNCASFCLPLATLQTYLAYCRLENIKKKKFLLFFLNSKNWHPKI